MQHEIYDQPCPWASGAQRRVLCPRCAFTGSHQGGPGSGPHYQRLVCRQCGAFLQWLPKPRPVVQEGRHA
jgi:hypothetical protein